MTFRENASLKTNQVRRGGGGGRRHPRGGSLAAGGGVGGILLLILYLVFGGSTGGLGGGSGGGLAQGSGWDYSSQDVGQEQGENGNSTEQFPECRTGEDANERVDCRMVGTVISVQDYWSETYRDYEPAQTVLFTGSVTTGCGAADSSVGPFYCPVDSTIYLDVSFFNQLDAMGGDGGSLSQMYVVAHEYGHHIQNLTGALARSQQDRPGPRAAPSGWSYRPTALPGSGWPTHRRPKTSAVRRCSNRSPKSRSIRRCRLLRRSAMTASRRGPRAGSTPMCGPTDRPSSVRNGF